MELFLKLNFLFFSNYKIRLFEQFSYLKTFRNTNKINAPQIIHRFFRGWLIIDYATKNDILNIRTYDRSWHYYAMGEHSKSIEYWNKTIDDFGDTSPRVFYHNFEKAIKSYLILNDPKGALEFLEKCKNILPQYALEFNYFIAKVALENKIKDRLGKKSLKYCEQNYKENKYFNKEDLDELRGE